ncbi:hypothetical protein N7519_002191 [Penicillium mononematosum]|uniref:uncharacterized protein n=1 Tax=Penicillium mononematosum TaxID=268346 RepID=UPI0025486340|nr:uncharacterized protein N7519_002191 [Penicillium mononematosum]KAJ6187283.1 hypothetical protein N7519_002191 [Penicillium mononematosum]
MALCLVPSVKFNTETEASQFLNHIRDVYDVTYKDEAECRAYCWFRKNGDPSIVQGFEFYENENALAITHRSSDPYKKMRQFLGTVQIGRPNGITHQPPSSMTPVVDSPA